MTIIEQDDYQLNVNPPMLKKINYINRIGLHAIFWIAVIFLYYIDYEPIGVYRTVGNNSFLLQEKAWGMALWNCLTCLPIAYINLFLVAYIETKDFAKKNDIGYKIAYFLLITPLLAAFSSRCLYEILNELQTNNVWIFQNIYEIQFNSTPNPYEIWYRNVPETVFIMVGLLAITQNTTLEKAKKNLEANKRDLEEKKIHLELQINLLRKRMEPHFLIGVLNAVFLEVNKKMPKVGDQIDLLSSQLRYILVESDKKEVLLKDEITFVRNYIRLKKLEQGNRNVDVKDRMIETDFADDRRIMPLMLVELVENAFKYSFNVKGKRYINIYIYADEDSNICIRIENKRPKQQYRNDNIKSTKEGIKNLKQRLELTYPNAYDFNIDEKESTQFVVFIIIKNKTL